MVKTAEVITGMFFFMLSSNLFVCKGMQTDARQEQDWAWTYLDACQNNPTCIDSMIASLCLLPTETLDALLEEYQKRDTIVAVWAIRFAILTHSPWQETNGVGMSCYNIPYSRLIETANQHLEACLQDPTNIVKAILNLCALELEDLRQTFEKYRTSPSQGVARLAIRYSAYQLYGVDLANQQKQEDAEQPHDFVQEETFVKVSRFLSSSCNTF